MAQRLLLDGRAVWLKRYGHRPRRLAHRALDFTARQLDLEPLRPDRVASAEEAKRIEARRLGELAGRGLRVPSVLGDGADVLLLSDVGASLSLQLREIGDRPAAIDRLVAGAVDAIAQAHRRGVYLGQPLPRNLTVDADGYGFLDFEEDPGRVMSLDGAQARDWLLFASGVARRYEARGPRALADLLAAGLDRARAPVVGQVGHAAQRLHFLERLTRPFGSRARALGEAVAALRHALGILALTALMLLDYLPDRDFDLLGLSFLIDYLT
ncbi:MAG TPA: serine/threonine protein phosphatase [Dokdonella sp.]|uniref:serine/threonine protein phosphatase n=1 Tax=Dokdonella sp. TaxID=2291710 RepID=UPI002BAC0462|nr:serine/threonine protein phosphatase [Dokdonella sp.]HUD40722.1 serine/threonine protein phosphatase [Dokdonella sp.]